LDFNKFVVILLFFGIAFYALKREYIDLSLAEKLLGMSSGIYCMSRLV